jgi:hypothetical protein
MRTFTIYYILRNNSFEMPGTSPAVALFVHNPYIPHSPLLAGVNGARNGITNTSYIMHTDRTRYFIPGRLYFIRRRRLNSLGNWPLFTMQMRSCGRAWKCPSPVLYLFISLASLGIN